MERTPSHSTDADDFDLRMSFPYGSDAEIRITKNKGKTDIHSGHVSLKQEPADILDAGLAVIEESIATGKVPEHKRASLVESYRQTLFRVLDFA